MEISEFIVLMVLLVVGCGFLFFYSEKGAAETQQAVQQPAMRHRAKRVKSDAGESSFTVAHNGSDLVVAARPRGIGSEANQAPHIQVSFYLAPATEQLVFSLGNGAGDRLLAQIKKLLGLRQAYGLSNRTFAQRFDISGRDKPTLRALLTPDLQSQLATTGKRGTLFVHAKAYPIFDRQHFVMKGFFSSLHNQQDYDDLIEIAGLFHDQMKRLI